MNFKVPKKIWTFFLHFFFTIYFQIFILLLFLFLFLLSKEFSGFVKYYCLQKSRFFFAQFAQFQFFIFFLMIYFLTFFTTREFFFVKSPNGSGFFQFHTLLSTLDFEGFVQYFFEMQKCPYCEFCTKPIIFFDS